MALDLDRGGEGLDRNIAMVPDTNFSYRIVLLSSGTYNYRYVIDHIPEHECHTCQVDSTQDYLNPEILVAMNRIPSSVGSDVASEHGKGGGAEYPKKETMPLEDAVCAPGLEEEEVDYEELWAESDERRHLARFWGLPGEEVERG